ncbi:MAG: M23 family metallopeptidase, partial [Nitrospiraceae bacterium]
TLAPCHNISSSASSLPPDAFTPVTVSPMGTSHSPVLGTDGLYHVVYELQVTNTKVAPATLRRIDVLDADAPSHILASYMDQDIIVRLRTLQPQPAESAVIEPNTSRLFYIELAFRQLDEVPHAITHHLYVLGAANPGTSTPTPLDYTVGRISLDRAPLPVLGPPLVGDGWVAANGCCNSGIVHRGSFQGVNGGLHDAQRFAIDYMRLNAQGELVHGDPSDVHDYVDYGGDVLAVADGTVVATLNHLHDQKPGTLPDPTSITLETVDGNHVIIDIGHGLYAFYAHLQKDSVTVHLGQHVKKGMVLGKLGNSGNTSAPHLHLHLMNGPSVLGSDGLPYLIDNFDLAGQIDVKAFDESPTLTGYWGEGRLKKVIPERDRFPLNLNIVNFPKQ